MEWRLASLVRTYRCSECRRCCGTQSDFMTTHMEPRYFSGARRLLQIHRWYLRSISTKFYFVLSIVGIEK